MVSVDNIASQLIGGYKALNAAFRKCRYCMATDEQMQTKVSIICIWRYYSFVKSIENR